MKIMSKFKKSLEDQQKINEAAEQLVEHFSVAATLADHYEKMAKTQALMMMTMGCNCKNGEIQLPAEVAFFFDDVRVLLELLRPFDEMASEDKK